MSESKHTAGPWAVNEDGFKVESENEHGWVNDGWVVCVTEGPDKESNARLIAAAPEILEALRNAKGFLDTPISRRRNEGDSFYSETVKSIRAAIAKAEGK